MFNHKKKYEAHSASRKHEGLSTKKKLAIAGVTAFIAVEGVLGFGTRMALTEHKELQEADHTIKQAQQVSETEQLLDEQITPALNKNAQTSLNNPNATTEDVVTQMGSNGESSLNYQIVIPNGGKTVNIKNSEITLKNGDAQISGGQASFGMSGSTLKLSGRY